MKCIHCGTDNRYRDRAASGGRCRGCKHPFAFEPHDDPYEVTDPHFHEAVQRVSGGGTVHFTARQLWYELERGWKRPTFWSSRWGMLTPLGAVAGGALGAAGIAPLGAFWMTLIGLVGGFVVGANRYDRWVGDPNPPPRVPFEAFRESYLDRWTEVHGPLPQLVPGPDPAAPPREIPPDVSVFSFDRAVVTQHADIAAMLVANRFHFEHNCAVLSLDGYPYGITDTVKEMLRRNPRLTVFALHDASVEGYEFLLALRRPEWFPEATTLIVDVGARTGVGLPVLPGRPVEVSEAVQKLLGGGSMEWYAAGNRAELAAERPTEIMRMLYRALAQTGLPGEPAYDYATSHATDGIIWGAYLAIAHNSGHIPGTGTAGGGGGGGGGDTSTTDGFG